MTARLGVEQVLVVVPARDEELRLRRCLDALAVAVARVAPAVGVRVVVVLDRCRDGSAQVVGDRPGVVAVTCDAGSAGGARRAGVAAGLHGVARSGQGPERVWVASTDADSTVPAHWLTSQLEAAARGADLVLGTVRPDPAEAPAALVQAWAAGYTEVEGHPHVHAANLGVRGSAYLAAGGFEPVRCHEDVRLAAAVARGGGTVVRTAAAPVTTSARLRARAPDGFAAHLAALAAPSG
ncbi:MAG: Glycosyl transferase, group 2 family [uncultured Quadrisphaera sp.]|uniref:4,4'-diaponeurosporenoate glycosyltransferase n=1 Tax=uncultured Quadrisphaera sp. TaxID=904978 RepID=A0A6J4NI07_9ACTN|nr:MAG: Glycosyl transferase, group 2 family [uncultured Quadrisphaera sp.]